MDSVASQSKHTWAFCIIVHKCIVPVNDYGSTEEKKKKKRFERKKNGTRRQRQWCAWAASPLLRPTSSRPWEQAYGYVYDGKIFPQHSNCSAIISSQSQSAVDQNHGVGGISRRASHRSCSLSLDRVHGYLTLGQFRLGSPDRKRTKAGGAGAFQSNSGIHTHINI